jgi:hypothetical protein|nr:MAG TPA: hypothetical protein [Caudoviricetes sp.]
MEIITFNDDNDVVSSVTLDGTLYKFRMLWNPDGYFWTLHLWDKHDNPLLTNVKVVPNFPLLFNKHCFNIPKGEFFVATKQKVIDRDAFADGRAALVYLTEEEYYNGTV